MGASALACRGGQHRLPDLFRRRVLEHVAAGSGFHRRQNVGVGVVGGEDEDGRCRCQQFDAPGGGDPIHPGAHLQVHQHQVHGIAQGLQPPQLPERSLAVGSLRHHGYTLEVRQHGP